MDSLSQIVLGAAVGEIMLGKKLGNRAQLLGAIAGTIPDLDVLLNPLFTDEITKLKIHRGYSHAAVFHLLLAWPLAWLSQRRSKSDITFKGWYLFWFLGLFTHALLDCCTTYGTQLLLPFTDYLVGFNNIAVVDPLWTLPFMALLIICLFIPRVNESRRLWVIIGCSYAALYMAFTLVNKFTVHQHFAKQLQEQGINCNQIKTSPIMFNNILWSGIALSEDSIYFGEYSLIQSDPIVDWVSFPRNSELIQKHPARREMEALTWFGQDAYFALAQGEQVDFFTAKWGRADFTKTEAHAAFLFHWRVEPTENGWRAIQVMPQWEGKDFREAMSKLWQRIQEKPLREHTP
jgi:inner membrane protein